MSSFGSEFIIINDVMQPLLPKVFGPGWIHLATVKRGFREYVAFKKATSDKVWIEIVDIHDRNVFKQIEDENEWLELALFLHDARLLEVGNRREIAVGKDGV